MSVAKSEVSNEELQRIRNDLEKANPSKKIRAWMIAEEVKKTHKVDLDESTIRGRFVQMGAPLSGGGAFVSAAKPKQQVEQSSTQRKSMKDVAGEKEYDVTERLQMFIPQASEFNDYIERDIDSRLALHYNTGKYPITQGKQGTGKTYSHMYYAYRNKMPFFLFSCYEDFKLSKLFGDKTIIEGTIIFKESLFVQAIQGPCVILFDEINAVSNPNTYDWHALLQNKELFIKDADNGNGKVYRLHPHCRMGFAQNPKSAKYIGGNIKQSNFLGRCTFISYPEFTESQIKEAISKRFSGIDKLDVNKFTKYYFAINDTIERAGIPVDISIRQLNNVIDLWLHGLPLRQALEDGLISILDAISQPKAKESFNRIADAVWKELMKKG
jgi:MoxR-like ATPase